MRSSAYVCDLEVGRLLALAGRVLRRNGCQDRAFTVRIMPEVGPTGVPGGCELVYRRVCGEQLPELPDEAAPARPAEPAAAPGGLPEGALWLSPRSARIVEALRGQSWMASDQVAQAIGEADREPLKVLLTELAARRLVDSQPGRGYRLRES